MSVWDVIWLLIGVAVFQSTLMTATVICMTVLHRVFDWNPFSTRRTRSTPARPGWEKTGYQMGEPERKHPGTVGTARKHE